MGKDIYIQGKGKWAKNLYTYLNCNHIKVNGGCYGKDINYSSGLQC